MSNDQSGINTDSNPNESSTPGKLKTYKTLIDTCNLPEGGKLDRVGLLLLMVRPCVLSLDVFAAMIAAFFAVEQYGYKNVNWWYFLLATFGIVLAHATNNMINDFMDVFEGVDTDDYVRAQYAPHPILNGLISKRNHFLLILLFTSVNGLIALFFWWKVSWLVMVFALSGLFLSVFYVAPPFKLKHHALGELANVLVWGPLEIGGVFLVMTGGITWQVLVGSLPLGLLVGMMLIGKHLDKYEVDKEKGIHTLPVLIGERATRVLLKTILILVPLLIISMPFLGITGYGVLIIVFSVKRLRDVYKAFSAPKPSEAPPNFPVWPLWYVALGFHYTKLAGKLFMFGLLINLFLPF